MILFLLSLALLAYSHFGAEPKWKFLAARAGGAGVLAALIPGMGPVTQIVAMAAFVAGTLFRSDKPWGATADSKPAA